VINYVPQHEAISFAQLSSTPCIRMREWKYSTHNFNVASVPLSMSRVYSSYSGYKEGKRTDAYCFETASRTGMWYQSQVIMLQKANYHP